MSGRPLVAVVGAGISGLAAAWALVGSGAVDVVVLEASATTGGVLRRGRVGPGGPLVDLGAESLLARRPEALDLARSVGLGADLVHPATTRAAVASRGALHPMPRGTLMGVPADAASLAGLLEPHEVERARAERLTPALGPDGDAPVGAWVAARLGPAVVDRLVEPLLGGVHAGHAGDLSLRSTVPALWPAARDGASALDAVRAAVPASGGSAAGGSAAGAPPAPVFAGLRGGVGRLAEATERALREAGVVVRTRALARSLRRAGPRWELAVETGGGTGAGAVVEELAVDGVVLALPPAPAARLLADAAPGAAGELAGVSAAGLALVSAVLPPGALDALVDDEGRALSGILVPPVEGRLVKAMTASSRKWEWVARQAAGSGAGGGPEVLRLSVGRAGEEAVLDAPDADLVAAALADASDLLGAELAPRAALLTRWPSALPQHAVGHVGRVERVLAEVAGLPGLAVAGATYEGVGVPACLATARRAADGVLGDLLGAGLGDRPSDPGARMGA